MESSIQFDMAEFDMLPFLTPHSAGLDFEGATGGVLLSPTGNWSLGGAPSPQYELRQDPSWGWDHADGMLSSPLDLCGDVQYLDDVGSDPLTSYKLFPQFPLGDSDLPPSPLGPQAQSPLGPLVQSPMDVKFELGMELSDLFVDQSAGYVDTIFESSSVSFVADALSSKPLFTLSGYDDRSVEALDSTVPGSPLLQDHDGSLLVDLDVSDDDSLHEEEIVCQLLRELRELDSLGPGGLHDASTTLHHVSLEEVDSVLSRDSSCENLAGLDEPISRPTLLPTVISNSVASPVSLLSPVAPVSFTIGSGYQQSDLVTKMAAPLASMATQPYGREAVLTERRERKKEQNKTAALRYRQKKREEKGHTTTEVDELEQKNAALRSRADELTKEINYLKGLLEEIRRQ